MELTGRGFAPCHLRCRLGYMNAQADASPAGAWHATCLILAPPGLRGGSGAVDLLVRSLERRGLEVRSARDAYEGMADLLIHKRHRRHEGRLDPIVLVLVEPERLRGAAALHEATLRHAPHAVLWEFHPGPPPSLRAFRGVRPGLERDLPTPAPRALRTQPEAPPAEHPAAGEGGAVGLRLTGEGGGMQQQPNQGGIIGKTDSFSWGQEMKAPLLTEEELSMLLGGPESQPGAGGNR